MKNPIDEVSASHLIDDAAYPSTTLHSSTSLVSFREVSRRSRSGHYTTFSDLRCNVACFCLFVMLRPIAVTFYTTAAKFVNIMVVISSFRVQP